MKRFDKPRMERVNLVREDIIAASICNDKYCDGYTCPQCDEDGNYCVIQSPCGAHQCSHYLCTTYSY